MSFIDIIKEIAHDKKAEILINGFESSQFSRDIPQCGIVIKTILEKLYENFPLKENDLYSTSGLILLNNTQLKNKFNSFSMEFQTISGNLLALTGYELSYNLSIIISLKSIVKQYIKHIADAKNYKEILIDVKSIRNIYKHNEFLVESLDEETPNNDFFCLNTSIVSLKEQFFNKIIIELENYLTNNSISLLNTVKTIYVKKLNNLLKNTKINVFEINTVNDLLHNIGKKLYDNWFIKIWSVLYDELFVDMRSINEAEKQDNSPLDYLYGKLGITLNKDKFITQFMIYYEQIILDTKSSLQPILKDDFLIVNISNELTRYLSEMMLNLYTQMAYNIYNYQRYTMFNKSIRIHYALLFYVIVQCTPKLFIYSNRQEIILRYILTPKKIIEESVNLIKDKENKESKLIVSSNSSKKTTRRKTLNK